MNAALRYASQICYSSKETLQFTYDMALKFKDIEGCYVECGCAAGAQIIAMASAAKDKKIFAFDSFDGIPLPSNRDDQMPGIAILTKAEQKALPDAGKQALVSSGATVVTLENFYGHLAEAFGNNLETYDSFPPIYYAGPQTRNVFAVKGWFEHTIPSFNTGQIALLRLDGDLYYSTWVCLEHLFPKVISGGCVIIDDIELPGCKAAVDEYFSLIGYQPDYKYVSNICYFFK